MPIDVPMPQMGESIFEGTITKWLKQVGDAVAKDEPLFEISTDKVDAEIPAPTAGVLAEIKFPVGAVVPVNAVVAVLSENGSSAQKAEETKTSAVRAVPPQVPEVPQVEVPMPQMGESIFEGTITKWLKQVGDAVQKDEPLFEISTDKVDAEIPAPSAGILAEIKFPVGATVPVNTVVAVLSAAGTSTPKQKEDSLHPAPQSFVAAEPQSPAPEVQPQSRGPQVEGLRSSPLVRRIAREHQINLAHVPGTGSNGRITKDDILGFLGQFPQGSAPPQVSPKAESAAPQVPKAGPLPTGLTPLTKMRALIAERMAESKRTIPHAHTVYKVDMTRIVRTREHERAAFEQRHGFKLTYMPFIAVATIEALRQFPIVNASLVEGGIQYHGNIHLGIAVALEWGLIVPVVRAAETRDFLSLARSIHDLATRARAKKLLPDEVGGSTFTLTNPGIFGGEYGMPIINLPESAILAIGGLRKEPVVLTDTEGNDTIAIRSVQYACLGFDHRLIDGADSGKFMTAFKTALETWNRPLA